jgi:DNA repair exonuclease SbcCD ATPase subunit
MKRINLKSLELKNFKGIKSFRVGFDENETFIHGANGVGKTTVFDAFTWLLFDKDSNGSAQFNIKTLDENNNPIHNLDHSVKGVFDIDGKIVELSKTYREKWVKKRGQEDQEFSGHETIYYFNDAPIQKKEYNERIEDIVNEEVFKVLTSPLYFNQINWKERRKTLLEIAGDISDTDIIESLTDCNVDALREILNEDKSFMDELKSIKAKKKKLKDDLKLFPARIDEATSSLEEGVNEDEINKAIKDAESIINEKQKELESISEKNRAEQQKQVDFDNKVFEKKQKLESVRREITKLEISYKDGLKEGLRSINQKIENNIEIVKSKESIYESKKQQSDELERDLNRLRQEVIKLKKEEFTPPTNSDKCNKCGQKLADSEVNVEELRLAFENNRNSKIEEISNKGKSLKTKLESVQSEMDVYQKEVQKLSEEHTELQQQKIQEQTKIENNAPFEAPKELNDKIVAIQLEIDKMERPEVKEQDNTDIHNSIKEQRDIIDAEKRKLYVNENNAKIEKRIQELREEQKQASSKLAKLEGIEYAIEQFDKQKMDLVESRVNKMFKLVKFKMFEEQINGGLNPVCDCLINGVPFSDLNTASKINAGIDIINSLKEYFKVSCPVIIDNRESITNIFENDLQIINLVVDSNQKTLTVK